MAETKTEPAFFMSSFLFLFLHLSVAMTRWTAACIRAVFTGSGSEIHNCFTRRYEL